MTENIVVTGFGPFRDHKINASWEAVKILPKQISGLNVIVKELQVSYDYIELHVPELWEKYTPKLVVHVGVSSIAHKVTIESCAHRDGYKQSDCLGKFNPTSCACAPHLGEDCIFGQIDGGKIAEHLNNTNVKVMTSVDAGRYLCEYVYYTSLRIDKNKTMFIHVPPLGEPYSAEELAEGLTEIIKCALQQVCSTC